METGAQPESPGDKPNWTMRNKQLLAKGALFLRPYGGTGGNIVPWVEGNFRNAVTVCSNRYHINVNLGALGKILDPGPQA